MRRWLLNLIDDLKGKACPLHGPVVLDPELHLERLTKTMYAIRLRRNDFGTANMRSFG